MENCIFCSIANHQIAASIVYEDEKVLAFNDLDPVAPVHVLVIPKAHIVNVNYLNEENVSIIADMHLIIKKIAEKLGIAEKGYRLISNCGADAGQSVLHLHYHLIGGTSLGPRII